MTPDVDIHDYYAQFVYDAKSDILTYRTELAELQKLKDELYKYITSVKDKLKNETKISLDKYSEYTDKTYNPTEHLYNVCMRYLGNTEFNGRIYVLQTTKYCNVLRNENKLNRLMELAVVRKNIKFAVYRKYVFDYYNKVHKCCLEGMAYRYGFGIGKYIINCWKLDEKRAKKLHLDYAATKARKKELLEQGYKLYDKKEAILYKSRNMPYNAVDYRVYKENTRIYEFTFIQSRLFRRSTCQYERNEYVNAKYRNMSYTEIADKICKNVEDIYALQVDIKYKLNMLLYKDPNKYLNYVRDVEQLKHKR